MLKNFRKYFIILLIFSTLLENFQLIWFDISIAAFAISIFKLNWVSEFKAKEFPLLLASMLLCLAQVLSAILGNDFTQYLNNVPSVARAVFRNICCDVLNLIIAWMIIKENSAKYISIALKTVLVYGFALGIYNSFEVISNSNPFVSYMTSKGWFVYEDVLTGIRYGIRRCQGFFGMHTTNGGVCLILGFILLYVKLFSNYFDKYKAFTNVTIGLLIAGVFFTGARSAIMGTIVSLFAFVNFKQLKAWQIIAGFVGIFVIFMMFGNYFDSIFASITNTQAVSGSNTSMREDQFDYAIDYFESSPNVWIGNGVYATQYFRSVTPQLLGAESIWIPEMIDRGILGIISLITLFISMIVYAIKKKNSGLVFLVLGFVLFGSMSSIPWFHISNIFIFMVFMVGSVALKGNPSFRISYHGKN